ncbi:class I SAM-dependent methyltransferase [Marinirhabdus gelatinilytica]|uniref:Methyltransferase family protein n=1 Tax=Marinirhabdus gelatinilytica TaxID=1703343 RepID=A0A370Q9W3_9FLAO|nr:class I SAM-dependent methyltransferase [Marinirhabdus gelatinilytica]RDK84810.1 methyltransferase family protein [Marinirhabdus gelatinilytica]
MGNKLTTQDYWEAYYSKGTVNQRNIINVCSYYDHYWNSFIDKNKQKQTIIEIGGYPGRYLAYLASRYNLAPTSLDYNSDTDKIKEMFEVMEVKNFTILQKDFTVYTPEISYDYVLSNGFIEHFNNFEEILDLHVKYMKKNGKLYVMIPNMKGYVYFYKYLVDRRNLKIHNLKSMRKRVFKNFAERNDLIIGKLEYFGDFPHAVHQKLNPIQKIICKIHRFLFKRFLNKILNKYPSPYFSSGIVAIFEKK